MKAISYIRYSSDGQSEGDSIERQTENIERYAKHNGLEIVDTITDEGKSASKGEHLEHGLGRILDRAIKGEFKGYALLIEHQDRLSRLDIAKTNILIGQLLGAGMIICVTEENRIIKDQNDLMTVILNAVRASSDAEYSKKLKERSGGAWNRKFSDAIKNGAVLTKNLPAWLEVKDGKIVEVTEPRGSGRNQKIPVDVVREMFRMASLGIGGKNICNTLGDKICSRVWVSNTLRSRAVLGEFVCKGTVIPDYFPQIIDQPLFDEVQRQIDLKQKNPGGNYRKSMSADNLFKDLIYDTTDDDLRPLYFCNPTVNGKAYGYLVSKFDKHRGLNRIPYRKIETAVLSFLTQEDWAAVAKASESDEVTASKAELTKVENEVGRVERQIKTTVAAMDEADVKTLRILSDRQVKLEEALTTLTERRDALATAVDAAIDQLAPLYEPQVMLNLIQQNSPESADVRLRLRTEISKRVSRISVQFNPNPLFDDEGVAYRNIPNVWVFVEYRNGVCHFASIESDGTVQTIRDGGRGVMATLAAVKELVARKRAAAGLS